MHELMDKCILLCFGIFLLAGADGAASVIALLLAVAAAAMGYYIEEKAQFCILAALFFLAGWIWPVTVCFFPLLLYDLLRRKCYVAMPPFLAFFAAYQDMELQQRALLLLTMLLAALLAYKTERERFLRMERIRIRDSGVEQNRMLMEQNRNLMELSDYEIHLATLKERNRIAREIHDNVGHMLTRSILMTGALLTLEKEGAAHSGLMDLKDTLNQAMDSIRKSVHNLHEESLDLKKAVYEIVEPMQTKFHVDVEYDMAKETPGKVKYCLIAVTKEAVSNILKHSGGDRVELSVREHPGFYRLLIRDNGVAKETQKARGMGLRNMKDRADALGGTLRIYTEQGFSIFLTIPKAEDGRCEL